MHQKFNFNLHTIHLIVFTFMSTIFVAFLFVVCNSKMKKTKNKQMRALISLTLLFFPFINLTSQEVPINSDQAFSNFNEIKKYCDSDNGKLWGENLWAPILLIDEGSRYIVANMPDKEKLLKKSNKVYTGYFPKDKGIANSTTNFGNENWMMVMFPLPENSYLRNVLCIHELYHRYQNKLNLKFGMYNNDHLDNQDARILIKLEWNALLSAIEADSKQVAKHLTNALIFRNYRRALYPGKDSMENKFEIQEGLAEYTGNKICSRNTIEFKNTVLKAKETNWNHKSFVRSFAYFSGLLYAYLLDQISNDWTTKITCSSDLGLLLKSFYKLKLPGNLQKAYEDSRNLYDYKEILNYENERERQRQEVLASYRKKFLKDTAMILYTKEPNIVFDPRNLIPLDTLGTVYPTIKIISDWGILQVNAGGCLYNWKKAILNARNLKQEENRLIGEGWEIELNEKWQLVKEGMDYKLIKTE